MKSRMKKCARGPSKLYPPPSMICVVSTVKGELDFSLLFAQHYGASLNDETASDERGIAEWSKFMIIRSAGECKFIFFILYIFREDEETTKQKANERVNTDNVLKVIAIRK